MSEFHLEALRDLELTGQATALELEQLRSHRRDCEVCRLEAALTGGLEQAETAANRAILDRVFRQVEEVVLDAPAPSRMSESFIADHAASRRKRRSPMQRRVQTLGAVAFVLIAGGAAAAAIPSVRRAMVQIGGDLVPSFLAEEKAPGVAPATSHASPPAEPPKATPPTPIADADPPRPEPKLQTARQPDKLANSASSVETKLDDAQLFEQASAARRVGDNAKAAGLYRELQARFPGSSRASVARLSLASLLLGPLKSPAEALAQYDAYLASHPTGQLAEQALVGKAKALRALGRTGAEAATWRRLLSEYPASLHADQARQRLGN